MSHAPFSIIFMTSVCGRMAHFTGMCVGEYAIKFMFFTLMGNLSHLARCMRDVWDLVNA